MSDHYTQERELQDRLERLVAVAFPSVEVLDVELDSPRETVRVFIDSPDGVDLELCSRVTKLVREERANCAFEVSSPGSERPLRKPEHFRAALGSPVKIRRRGRPRPLTGTVAAVDHQSVTLVRPDEAREQIPLTEIVRSRVIPVDPQEVLNQKGLQA